MTIQNLITVLDQWAPPSYAEDFDNVGLLVGDAKKECLGALITCLLYTSPSPRDSDSSRMPSSA